MGSGIRIADRTAHPGILQSIGSASGIASLHRFRTPHGINWKLGGSWVISVQPDDPLRRPQWGQSGPLRLPRFIYSAGKLDRGTEVGPRNVFYRARPDLRPRGSTDIREDNAVNC